MKELEPLIQSINGMVNFSKEEMDLFTQKMEIKHFKKGAYLLEESKIANSIFFINKGLTRNVVRSPDGTEATQFFSIENTFVTEYASFLYSLPSIYGIQAIENTEAVVIPKESIEQGYLQIKEGNKLGRLIAESYFVRSVRNVYERQTQSLMERYNMLENEFPNIHQRVPQHMIASYLEITPVHLSRIKSQSRGS